VAKNCQKATLDSTLLLVSFFFLMYNLSLMDHAHNGTKTSVEKQRWMFISEQQLQ
jgi:hypothetical protein